MHDASNQLCTNVIPKFLAYTVKSPINSFTQFWVSSSLSSWSSSPWPWPVVAVVVGGSFFKEALATALWSEPGPPKQEERGDDDNATQSMTWTIASQGRPESPSVQGSPKPNGDELICGRADRREERPDRGGLGAIRPRRDGGQHEHKRKEDRGPSRQNPARLDLTTRQRVSSASSRTPP